MALRWLLAALGIGLVIFAGWLVNQPGFCSGPIADLFGPRAPQWMVPLTLLLGFALTAASLALFIGTKHLSLLAALAIFIAVVLGTMSAFGMTILNTGPLPADVRHCRTSG
jgi:MFS family permease